jgi:hypothetical protein
MDTLTSAKLKVGPRSPENISPGSATAFRVVATTMSTRLVPG